MRAVCLIVIWMLACTAPAGAGPWLRDKGATFLSMNGTFRRDGGYLTGDSGIYAEYGLATRLTLGLTTRLDTAQSGEATVFFRFPLSSGDTKWLKAVEIGLGGYRSATDSGALYSAALTVGRNLTLGKGGGWFVLDTKAERRSGQPSTAFKLDATLGRSGAARFQPLLALGVTQEAGKPTEWRAAASVMIAAKDERTWVVGIERKQAATTSHALTFSLWRRF